MLVPQIGRIFIWKTETGAARPLQWNFKIHWDFEWCLHITGHSDAVRGGWSPRVVESRKLLPGEAVLTADGKASHMKG